MTLYQSLKAIFLHIDNREKALLNQYALSIPRFYVLMHVHQNPGFSCMELSDLMLCTKSNISRVLYSMERDGLLIRKTHPADARTQQVFLSKVGRELFERVYPVYLQQIEELMSLFDDQELEAYTLVSQHIESSLAPQAADTSLTSASMPLEPARALQACAALRLRYR